MDMPCWVTLLELRSNPRARPRVIWTAHLVFLFRVEIIWYGHTAWPLSSFFRFGLVDRLRLMPNVSDCAEVLFLPSFTAQGAIEVHDSSFPNVMMRGVYTRKDLCANAGFSGGARFLW